MLPQNAKLMELCIGKFTFPVYVGEGRGAERRGVGWALLVKVISAAS